MTTTATTTPTPTTDRELDRAVRRVKHALPSVTDAEARRIAALDLAIRRTMGEPR